MLTDSEMKIRIICDPDWSTGSIAKDLAELMPFHDIKIHSWRDYAYFPSDELLVCFSMLLTCRWPNIRTRNSIHLCCHPHEVSEPEVRNLITQNTHLFWGGVSRECRDVVQNNVPGSYVHLLPASVRANRFTRKKRPGKRIAGFIGRPYAQNIQITGGIKHPDKFLEICRTHQLTPRFSNQDYTYDTMQSFYDEIDYLICTSSSEGGPLGPFEAAMCGVPVISTKVGFWGECDMGGYFANAYDPMIALHLMNSEELASQQFTKTRSVSMEALLPSWEAAIQLVGKNA
jgi:glycosyltransferase involved in cell wall biosynthesis